jgi:hypothetical protein
MEIYFLLGGLAAPPSLCAAGCPLPDFLPVDGRMPGQARPGCLFLSSPSPSILSQEPHPTTQASGVVAHGLPDDSLISPHQAFQGQGCVGLLEVSELRSL